MSFVNVILKRLTTALRTTEAIQDGKIILDYERPSIYLDNGTTRIDMTPRDTALSTTSTNAIENQAVRNAIVNTNTTTVVGFMADARQLNPNVGGSLANKVYNNSLYSLTEHVIGTWIDGKPIYSKTVDCGALPNSATKSIAHGISNLKRVINRSGYAYNGTVTASLPFVNSASATNQIAVDVDSTNIVISDGINFSAYTETYITLEYTKTTD